jgi:hypothetical protein
MPRALGGGFGGSEEGKSGPSAEDLLRMGYKPPRLPLSAKAARAWVALHETKITTLPGEHPLEDIIRKIREAVRSPREKTPPFQIYVDPIGLQEAEKTLTSPTTNPFLEPTEVSVHTYLGLILKQLGLAHRVRDGLVMIESAADDRPIDPEVTAAEARTWLALHEEIPLHYADETPLEDVLRAVQRAESERGRRLIIYVDPVGLQEAEKTLTSPLVIDMEGVPLGTSLKLALRQLGLSFRVRGDGVLDIFCPHSDEADDNELLTDESDVAEAYQRALARTFAERRFRLMGGSHMGSVGGSMPRPSGAMPEAPGAPNAPGMPGGFR